MTLPVSEILTLGYGSGDAAEVIPFIVSDGWREATARIGFGKPRWNLPSISTSHSTLPLHDGRRVDQPGLPAPAKSLLSTRSGAATSASSRILGSSTTNT